MKSQKLDGVAFAVDLRSICLCASKGASLAARLAKGGAVSRCDNLSTPKNLLRVLAQGRAKHPSHTQEFIACVSARQSCNLCTPRVLEQVREYEPEQATLMSSDGEMSLLEKFHVFFNFSFDKGRLRSFVLWFLTTYGESKTIRLLEKLKEVGFGYATKAGISLGIDDLRVPSQKTKLMVEADNKTNEGNLRYTKGEITGVERLQNFINVWHETSENLKKEVVNNFEATDILNPVYMMAFSGARGNMSQVRQLVGMRGLMSDPQGQIIDFPIRSNFREGLSLTEYVISTYGARKGIVDTALRTANAGYLTRRLVDVAQHVIISEFDCKTTRGIFVFDMKEGTKTIYSLRQRLIGRVLAEDIFSGHTKMAFRNQEISSQCADILTQISKKILIRSPLTCDTKTFVCQLCYGWSLASNRLVPIGEAVGVIAGQSIGEPGTQLTMRTFHTGGVFSAGITDQIITQYDGFVSYPTPIAGTCVRTPQGEIAFLTKSEGFLILKPLQKENHLSTLASKPTKKPYALMRDHKVARILKVPPYSLLFARNGQRVFKKQLVALFGSSGEQKKQTMVNEQTVYTQREGEIYTRRITVNEFSVNESLRLKPGNEDIPKQFQYVSQDWSKLWVLAGKTYQIPMESYSFPVYGDLVSSNSIVNQIGWVGPKFASFQKETIYMPISNASVISQTHSFSPARTSFKRHKKLLMEKQFYKFKPLTRDVDFLYNPLQVKTVSLTNRLAQKTFRKKFQTSLWLSPSPKFTHVDLKTSEFKAQKMNRLFAWTKGARSTLCTPKNLLGLLANGLQVNMFVRNRNLGKKMNYFGLRVKLKLSKKLSKQKILASSKKKRVLVSLLISPSRYRKLQRSNLMKFQKWIFPKIGRKKVRAVNIFKNSLYPAFSNNLFLFSTAKVQADFILRQFQSQLSVNTHTYDQQKGLSLGFVRTDELAPLLGPQRHKGLATCAFAAQAKEQVRQYDTRFEERKRYKAQRGMLHKSPEKAKGSILGNFLDKRQNNEQAKRQIHSKNYPCQTFSKQLFIETVNFNTASRNGFRYEIYQQRFTRRQKRRIQKIKKLSGYLNFKEYAKKSYVKKTIQAKLFQNVLEKFHDELRFSSNKTQFSNLGFEKFVSMKTLHLRTQEGGLTVKGQDNRTRPFFLSFFGSGGRYKLKDFQAKRPLNKSKNNKFSYFTIQKPKKQDFFKNFIRMNSNFLNRMSNKQVFENFTKQGEKQFSNQKEANLSLNRTVFSLPLKNVCFKTSGYNFYLTLKNSNRKKSSLHTNKETFVTFSNLDFSQNTQKKFALNTYGWKPNTQTVLQWTPKNSECFTMGILAVSNFYKTDTSFSRNLFFFEKKLKFMQNKVIFSKKFPLVAEARALSPNKFLNNNLGTHSVLLAPSAGTLPSNNKEQNTQEFTRFLENEIHKSMVNKLNSSFQLPKLEFLHRNEMKGYSSYRPYALYESHGSKGPYAIFDCHGSFRPDGLDESDGSRGPYKKNLDSLSKFAFLNSPENDVLVSNLSIKPVQNPVKPIKKIDKLLSLPTASFTKSLGREKRIFSLTYSKTNQTDKLCLMNKAILVQNSDIEQLILNKVLCFKRKGPKSFLHWFMSFRWGLEPCAFGFISTNPNFSKVQSFFKSPQKENFNLKNILYFQNPAVFKSGICYFKQANNSQSIQRILVNKPSNKTQLTQIFSVGFKQNLSLNFQVSLKFNSVKQKQSALKYSNLADKQKQNETVLKSETLSVNRDSKGAKLDSETHLLYLEKYKLKNKENILFFNKPLHTDQRKFAKIVTTNMDLIHSPRISKLSVGTTEIFTVPQENYKLFVWRNPFLSKTETKSEYINIEHFSLNQVNRQGKKQVFHSKLTGFAKLYSSFKITQQTMGSKNLVGRADPMQSKIAVASTKHMGSESHMFPEDQIKSRIPVGLPKRYVFHSPYGLPYAKKSSKFLLQTKGIQFLQNLSFKKSNFMSRKNFQSLLKNTSLKHPSLSILSDVTFFKTSKNQLAGFANKIDSNLKNSILKAVKNKLRNGFGKKPLNSFSADFCLFGSSKGSKGTSSSVRTPRKYNLMMPCLNQTSFLGHFIFRNSSMKKQFALNSKLKVLPEFTKASHNQFLNLQIQQGWLYIPFGSSTNIRGSFRPQGVLPAGNLSLCGPDKGASLSSVQPHMLRKSHGNERLYMAPKFARSSEKSLFFGQDSDSRPLTKFTLNHQSFFTPGKIITDDIFFERNFVFTKYLVLKQNNPNFIDKEEFVELQKEKSSLPPFTKITKIIQNKNCRFKPPFFIPLKLPYVDKSNTGDPSKGTNSSVLPPQNCLTTADIRENFRESSASTQTIGLSDHMQSSIAMEKVVVRVHEPQRSNSTVLMFLPMTHKILPNSHSSKQQIYRTQKAVKNLLPSLSIKNTFHSSILNKQKCDEKFISTYPGMDFHLSARLTLPTFEKNKTNKFSVSSGIWNFKRSKKGKNFQTEVFKKNEVPLLSLKNNSTLKGFIQHKLTYSPNQTLSTANEGLHSDLGLYGSSKGSKRKQVHQYEHQYQPVQMRLQANLNLHFYFSYSPVNFLTLQLETSVAKDFSYIFNKLKLTIQPISNIFTNKKNSFSTEKTYLSELVLKSKTDCEEFVNFRNFHKLVFYQKEEVHQYKSAFASFASFAWAAKAQGAGEASSSVRTAFREAKKAQGAGESSSSLRTKTNAPLLPLLGPQRHKGLATCAFAAQAKEQVRQYEPQRHKGRVHNKTNTNLCFSTRNNLVGVLAKSTRRILSLSLSTKMSFLVNQRNAAKLFTNQFLKSFSKPSFFPVSYNFLSAPVFKNSLYLNKDQTINKNERVGFTSFFSSFDGEIIPFQTNTWLTKIIKPFLLVLTKSNLLSFSLTGDQTRTFSSVRPAEPQKYQLQKQKNGSPDSSFVITKDEFKQKLFEYHQKYVHNQNKMKLDYASKTFKLTEVIISHTDKLYKVRNLPVGFSSSFKLLKVGGLMNFGDLVSPGYAIDKPGQVIHLSSQTITLRRAQMFRLSPNTVLHKLPGEFINADTAIVTLPFTTFKTGDIVQGIPKVEQYFEARETKAGRLFYGSLPSLLHNLCKRYSLFLPRDLAVRKSVLKIQQILVDGVQRVYRSQGVDIIDKHLEVIVRQMTTKVQILHPGETSFFPGELMDLAFVENINARLSNPIRYEPVVLGITRASLEVDSFLSAASFQHTVKVLSKAALYKKKDFLKGLKENLITANLIRAGTGYFVYPKNRLFFNENQL